MSRFSQPVLLLVVLPFLVVISLSGCHLLEWSLLRSMPTPAERLHPCAAPPDKNCLRLPPYVFFADFELNGKLPLFRELEQLRDQVYHELLLPDSNRMIQVHLYHSREKYEAAMAAKYPQLPRRRAFFVAQPRPIGGTEDLLVYTYWGDRIQEDLRHELTHALLHSVLQDVPLWLDEGLAEYFEAPPGSQGVHPRHLDVVRQTGAESFPTNLERLEKLTQLQDMTPAEYREAWAWVHFMLRGNPQARQILISYLRELRVTSQPGPLRTRLETVAAVPETALRQHLGRIDSRAAAVRP